MRNLLILAALLFQLSFADLIGRSIDQLRALLSAPAVSTSVDDDTSLSTLICITIYNGAMEWELCYAGSLPPEMPVPLGG